MASSLGGTCVDPSTVLVVSLDLSEGRGTFREKILFEGDETLEIEGGARARACDLREGDAVAMERERVGRVTMIARKTRRAAPKTAPEGAKAERVYA
ncbi:hypothetical protein EON77_21245, partial [bacterium]